MKPTKYLVLLMLFSAIDVCADEVDLFFGDWCISSVERYRGGLTTEEQAMSKIGKKLHLSKNKYLSFHSEVDSPIYRYVSEKVVIEEGVIPKKNSIFYGVYPEREVLKSIKIYEPSDQQNEWTDIEILNTGTFFELYDGFIYLYSECI